MALLNNMLKVLLNTKRWIPTILTGGVYPIVPEEDEDDF
jgi:hypothetical protein